MTPEELSEIKERAEKATPGPWSMGHCDYALGGFLDDLFIAHAREDVPKLIDEIDALRAELKNEKSFSENMTLDVLSAVSQFSATPEKGYLEEPLQIPIDIERIGKERDALKAENEKHKIDYRWLREFQEEQALKLRSRVAKLREALKIITSNGLNRGMGWTPSQHARIALAQDDEACIDSDPKAIHPKKDVSDEESGR